MKIKSLFFLFALLVSACEASTPIATQTQVQQLSTEETISRGSDLSDSDINTSVPHSGDPHENLNGINIDEPGVHFNDEAKSSISVDEPGVNIADESPSPLNHSIPEKCTWGDCVSRPTVKASPKPSH